MERKTPTITNQQKKKKKKKLIGRTKRMFTLKM